MTDSQAPRATPHSSGPESRAGLRLRIWIGCLGGALAAAAGVWWVIGTRIGPNTEGDPATLMLWLAGTGALGIAVGGILAIWLDTRIIGHLRGLHRSLASGQVQDLRGLPAASGWGELSDLTQQVQLVVSGRRQASRAADELGALQQQIDAITTALARWGASDRWEPIRVERGPLAPLAAVLDRGFARAREAREQNDAAARLVRVELESSVEDARESVEQAERGFVEATALLTTVRELQRLGVELTEALERSSFASAADASVSESYDRSRAAAAAAIEELVTASSESVDHLAAGLSRVREISEIVHTLANRATLIALNVVLASARGAEAADRTDEVVADLKALAREVREATGRTDALSRDVEVEVEAAAARMRGIRERIAARLDEAPPLPAAGGVQAPEDVLRLHERVREMIQDATTKGERLAVAGERASRAADRLLRRLEDETREMEGMVVRLGPPESALPEEPRVPEARGRGGEPRVGPLRLLEPDPPSGEEPEASGGEERP